VAEGLVEGLLGGEAEESEAKRRASKLDPLAAAAILQASAKGAKLHPVLTTYLEEQTRLTRLEAHHFEEERELGIGAAKRKRLSDQLRIAFQLLLALIVTAIGVGLVVMIHDAFTSRSVVIDPFSAPPALAARGLNGQVVGAGVLDRLTQLQASTRSNSIKRHISNAWTGEIRLEVPETGISIGEIDRLLKARFGKDIHIEGDLVQTPNGGLALTVRGSGLLPKTFEGAAADLDKLTTQAAEYIYAQSEPALYLVYLSNSGRNAEIVPFAKAIYANVPPEERPYILNQWANALSTLGAPLQDGLRLYLRAVALKPDYWIAHNNVMNALWGMGREEEAWRAGEAMKRIAGGRPGDAPELYYQNADTLTWNLQAARASITADAEAHGGVGSVVVANGPSLADLAVRLHDFAEADLQLQTALADAGDPTVAAMGHFIRGRIAAERGDVARAAREMEAFAAAYADPEVSSQYPGYDCWVAPVEEAAGHPDKADALLRRAGSFVDCYRFRADILDRRGDWPAAQRAYAAAVKLAPDLPAGYYSWGLALARHGDLNGAAGMFAAANKRGPNWADPLKAWGDVLLRQGDREGAQAKYRVALAKAPTWRELRAVAAGVH
jgi:tetratricopeptide (TPR) repeat protein